MTAGESRLQTSDDCPHLLSSYVCKGFIKIQNSQILRRPQDDIKSGRLVILRPPKGLAVLPSINKGLCHVNHLIFVILRLPKDLAVLPCINIGLCCDNTPSLFIPYPPWELIFFAHDPIKRMSCICINLYRLKKNIYQL
jgi:hypothetical protein